MQTYRMGDVSRHARGRGVFVCGLLAALGIVPASGLSFKTATAQVFTWDANASSTGPQDGSGTWSTTDQNWWNGSANVAWPNPGTTGTATFGAGVAGGYTVTTGTNLTADRLIFNTGNYTIAGSGTLTVVGSNSRPAPDITMTTTSGTVTMSAPLKFTTNTVTIGSEQTSGSSGGSTLVFSGGIEAAGRDIHFSGGNGGGQPNYVFSGGVVAANSLIAAVWNRPATDGGVFTFEGGVTATFNLLQANNDHVFFYFKGNSVVTTGTAATGLSSPRFYLQENSVFGTKQVNMTNAANGHFYFDGGTLRADASNANLLNIASGVARVVAGARIDTNGFDVGVTTRLDNTGTGGLTKLAVGTLTLSGSNSFSGGSTVAGGTLLMGHAFALGGTGGSLAVNVGTLNMGGFSPTVGVLSGSAGGVITTSTAAGTATLTTAVASGTANYAGTVSDNGAGLVAIAKNGAGALQLSASNAFSGGLAVNAGAVIGGAAGAFGTGTIAMAGTTSLAHAAGVSNAIGGVTFSGQGNRSISSGSGTTLTVNGPILGDTLTNASTITLGGAGATTTYNANLSLGSANVIFQGDAGLGTTAQVISGGTLTAGSVTYNANRDSGSTLSLTNGASASVAQLTGFQDHGNITLNASSLTVSGTWSLGNVTGQASLQAGSRAAAGQITSQQGMVSGGIVFAGGTLSPLASSTNWISSGVRVTSSATTGVIDTNGFDVTANASFQGGGSPIVKAGAGTLLLTNTSNVNSFSAGFAINAGTLRLSDLRAVGTGTVSFTGTAGRMALASSGTLATPLRMTTTGIVDVEGNAVTLSGVVSGAAGLTKAGGGLLSLTSANTFTGPTTISAGTLALGAGGAFSDSSLITVGDAGSAGVVLDLTAKTGGFSLGAGQTLAGGGTVRLVSSGTLNVLGTFAPGNSPGLFTYDGGTTVLAGTTEMEILGTTRATSASHGAGFYDAVNVINGGTLDFGGGTLALTFASEFATDTTFDLFSTLDTAALAGNFSSVTVNGSFYTGLTWTQAGTVWRSSNTAGGQTLEFSSTNGQLVIVPEPAAAGIAVLGLILVGGLFRNKPVGRVSAAAGQSSGKMGDEGLEPPTPSV